ncbi:tRNA (guanine-N7-)-methyltransferase [Paenibacillus shirakamiensis]|uniref:tRNA (guanine-N(7)-)-methyltransferase n=1 Tax=Paenibacillus shirakamiensis TaxID=1265935 RepID=A0ABS4JHQ6_9BACL|nr:tRNA (guanosine(46)-N7)-methyltransferase TrmB [Paenibacillus shirakamiensis]MBP2000501.1 tRNA (guanine-N7-)-methyltransferase [Paenibacillus shirakamiensis]
MRLRGRKGIRENLEAQQELVVLNPREYKGRWAEFFGNDNPIYIELGMGKGQFISGMSAKYPDCNFIGMDMYDELIRRASEKARNIWLEQGENEPPNVKLALGNIEDLEEFFAPDEVERVYLNFSDPWPKSRHGRRRLTHPRFLDKYKVVLNDKGEIHFKTDSLTLFEFSLNSFAASGLQMSDISLSLHREGINEAHIMTEYETKFHNQNMPIYRVEVKMGSQALKQYHEHKMEKF